MALGDVHPHFPGAVTTSPYGTKRLMCAPARRAAIIGSLWWVSLLPSPGEREGSSCGSLVQSGLSYLQRSSAHSRVGEPASSSDESL